MIVTVDVIRNILIIARDLEGSLIGDSEELLKAKLGITVITGKYLNINGNVFNLSDNENLKMIY